MACRQNCDATAGTYFPFNVTALNALANPPPGRRTPPTACRPCIRFGHRTPLRSSSTDIAAAARLTFHSDVYFYECVFLSSTLPPVHLAELRSDLHSRRAAIAAQVPPALTVTPIAGGGSVADLPRAAFDTLTGPQACNVVYFSFWPRVVDAAAAAAAGADGVRYAYNGSGWAEVGPPAAYFRPPAASTAYPQDALEVRFSAVEDLAAAAVDADNGGGGDGGDGGRDGGAPTRLVGGVLEGSDASLLAPNSLSLVQFRSVEVSGELVGRGGGSRGAVQYPFRAATSGYLTGNIVFNFGYWVRLFVAF